MQSLEGCPLGLLVATATCPLCISSNVRRGDSSRLFFLIDQACRTVAYRSFGRGCLTARVNRALSHRQIIPMTLFCADILQKRSIKSGRTARACNRHTQGLLILWDFPCPSLSCHFFLSTQRMHQSFKSTQRENAAATQRTRSGKIFGFFLWWDFWQHSGTFRAVCAVRLPESTGGLFGLFLRWDFQIALKDCCD